MQPAQLAWEDGSVESLFDDLLLDYGVHVGQPRDRRAAVRRLVEGAKLTADDAKLLRWYFDGLTSNEGIRNMGAFISQRISNSENCLDLAKGARRLHAIAEKKQIAASKSGINLPRDTVNSTAEQFARGVVRSLVEDFALDREAAIEHFGTGLSDSRLEEFLIEHFDLLRGYAAAGPKELQKEIGRMASHYHALWMARED